MILVVVEKTMDGICSAKNVFYQRYPKSARSYVTSYTDQNTLAKLQSPPLLQVGWLIEVDYNISKDILKRLSTLSDSNLVIINTENLKQFNAARETLVKLGLPFKMVDNRRPPDEKIRGYISQNLSIAPKAAEYLVKKYDRYMPDIIRAVNDLRRYDYVDLQTAKSASPDKKGVALYEIIGYLLNYDSHISYEQAVSLVYDYRYGGSYLLSYVTETLEQYIEVFKQIELGNLSARNAAEFRKKTDNKKIKDLNEYQLLHMIEGHRYVPADRLYYLYLKVSSMKRNSYSLYRFIYLLKISSQL